MRTRTFKLYTQQIPNEIGSDEGTDLQYLDDLEELDCSTDYHESSAQSSPQSQSSSIDISRSDDFQDLSILLDPIDSIDESDDDEDFFVVQDPKKRRNSPLSDIQKTRLVLQFMRTTLSRFSLSKFLSTLFSADDGGIKNFANIFLSHGGLQKTMDLCWNIQDPRMVDWVIEKAAMVCSREAGFLSDRAARGPYPDDVRFLRVSSKDINIEMLNKFRIYDLCARYERITPNLQVILKSVIGTKEIGNGSRNPDAVSCFLFALAQG